MVRAHILSAKVMGLFLCHLLDDTPPLSVKFKHSFSGPEFRPNVWICRRGYWNSSRAAVGSIH
jgi:hypothetical protein